MLTFSIFPNFPWIALLLSNAAFTLVMLGLSSAAHTMFQYLSTVIQAEGAEKTPSHLLPALPVLGRPGKNQGFHREISHGLSPE